MSQGFAAAEKVGQVNKAPSSPEALNRISLNNKTLNPEVGIKPIVEYFHRLA